MTMHNSAHTETKHVLRLYKKKNNFKNSVDTLKCRIKFGQFNRTTGIFQYTYIYIYTISKKKNMNT